MARSAADLGLELEVLAGPDELAEGSVISCRCRRRGTKSWLISGCW
jgi:hypothetical protein